MEEIYKKYSMLVYGYLYTLTRNNELSEELMQDTFYRAIKSINKFRNECKLSVWLCQIAKNLFKEYVKKHKKLKLVSLEDEINVLFIEENFTDEIEENEEVNSLYKAICKFPDKVKELFYLKMKNDLSFKEIGEITGNSESWCRVTFYRYKMKLKEEFNKYE